MAAGFHEVRFPLRLSLGTSGGPERRTEIVNLSNGREARNRRWRDARRRYDAGSGLKSLDDLYAVLAFFEARSGALYGFRFRDPLDFRSGPPGRAPQPSDQLLGIATGSQTRFALIKTYADAGGASQREIAKPAAGTVIVAEDGVLVPPARYTVDTVAGAVEFLPAFKPGAGAAVTAGFEFDVPVRFDTERIEVDLAAFRAGRIPSIPLVEIKP